MGKKISKNASPEEKVEITVSTYWPTRIIKSVTINDLSEDSTFRESITLENKEAKYVLSQLQTLFEKVNQ